MAEARAQDAVTCGSCASFVRHFCLTCSFRLCDNCKSLHDPTHNVVLFNEKHSRASGMCIEHNEIIQLYCKTCGNFVCVRCLLSRHNGHNLVELEETYKLECAKYKKKTEEIKRSAIFGTQMSLEKTQKNMSDMRNSVGEIRSSMKRDTATAKQIIDESLAERLQELEKFETDISNLHIHQESIIRKRLKDLETDVANREHISKSDDHIWFLKEAKKDNAHDKGIRQIPEGISLELPVFSGKLTDLTKQSLRLACGSFHSSEKIPDARKLIQYVAAPSPKHWKTAAVVKKLDVGEYFEKENLAKMHHVNEKFFWVADERHTAIKFSRDGELQDRLKFSQSEEILCSDIICLNGSIVICSPQMQAIVCPELQISWQLDSNEYPCCICIRGNSFVVLVHIGLFTPKYKLKFCKEGGAQDTNKVTLDKRLQSLLSKSKFHPDFMELNSVDETIVISHKSVVVGSTLDGKFIFEYGGQTNELKGENFCPQGLAIDRHGHVLIADSKNSCIHMLDSRGNFLIYIATSDHGLDSPVPLSIDSDGLLWIGEYSKKAIIVLDYLL